MKPSSSHKWDSLFCINKTQSVISIKKKIAVSKSESIYMWNNVDNTIQMIDSWNDLFSKTTDLYYPQNFSKKNEDCLLKSSHIIGKFVPMKKPHDFMYGFNSQCTSINEQLSKL